MAIALLESSGIPTEHLRSKSWEEFATAGAPEIDIVITVCDSVAGEVCDLAGPSRHRALEIGRAHVSTPVTTAHLVCRLLLETTQTHTHLAPPHLSLDNSPVRPLTISTHL